MSSQFHSKKNIRRIHALARLKDNLADGSYTNESGTYVFNPTDFARIKQEIEALQSRIRR